MGKSRTPSTAPSSLATTAAMSPFGRFSFDPEAGTFSFTQGKELSRSRADETARREILRQLLPELGFTSPQRESIRGRFEQALFDRLRDRIQESFSEAQRETLEQLGARNLLASSIEARRLGDLEERRMQATLDAAREAILESEELRRQDEQSKLSLLRALEEGIADEFSRRLQAARTVSGIGLQGAGLQQRAQEFLDQSRFSPLRQQLRLGNELLTLLGRLSRGLSLT